MKILKLLFTLLFAVFVNTTAFAQGSEQEEAALAESKKISSEVLSPFCPGRALNDCPSSAATDLKHKITEMLADGKSPQEVKDYLFSLYGDSISAVPRTTGFGIFAWITPFVFLAIGFICFLTWLKASKKKVESNSAVKPIILDDEARKRIELEINS